MDSLTQTLTEWVVTNTSETLDGYAPRLAAALERIARDAIADEISKARATTDGCADAWYVGMMAAEETARREA